jgi:hypothetical protein
MRFLLIIFFSFLTALTFAQQQPLADTLKTSNTGCVSKLRQAIKSVNNSLTVSTDTLKVPGKEKTDSLSHLSQHAADSLNKFNPVNKINSKEDSLQHLINNPLEKLNNKVSGVQQNSQHKIDSVLSQPASLEQKLMQNNPVAKSTDSIQTALNNAQQKLEQPLNKIQDKAAGVENKVSSSVTQSQNKIESKLKEVTDGQANIPGIGEGKQFPKSDLSLNSDAIKLPQTDLPNANLNLPTANTNVNKGVTGVGDVKLPELPSVNTDVSKVKLPEVKSLDKVKSLSADTRQLDGKLADAEKYEGDLSKLKEGEKLEALPQDAEKQVKNIGEVKGLSGEIDRAKKMQTEQEALIKKYQDKKQLQEEVKKKAMNVANDQLGKNAEVIKEAQNKLSIAKKKSGSVKSFKDIFKKRSDELDGKKYYERFVPGITFQTHNKSVFSMDMGMQIGYRLSPRFTTGVGVTYSAAFDKKFDSFVKGTGAYGSRFYVDVNTVKSIFVHAELEYQKLNPDKFIQPIKNDLGNRNAYSSYFGLGKKFNITRKISGSAIALYRLEYSGHIPSANKFLVRIGFDYRIRKEKKLIPKF